MQPSLLTRFRWWLEELWDERDARMVVVPAVLVVLILGGFFAARAVAHTSSTSSTGAPVHAVNVRQKVHVRVHGRLVTRWRTRRVFAEARTVLQTQTIQTPSGTRVVTRPVTRYHVVYRKHVVTVNGRTSTVLEPVTSTQTLTNTKTDLVTVTHGVTSTDVETITEPVTVVRTTTVVSTETVPAITITVTVP